MKIDRQTRSILENAFGLGDVEISQISPNVIRIIQNMELLKQYKLQAEVVDSTYCSAGIRTGEKFVFSAMPILLLSDESTAAPCMRALGILTPFLNTMADRIVAGVDPGESIWSMAECMDLGIGNGGLGKVRFRFSAIRS